MLEDIKNAIAKNLPAEIRVQLLEKLSECDRIERINEGLINKNDRLQMDNQRLQARLKLEVDFNEKEKAFQKKEIDFSQKKAVLDEREKWSQKIYESNLELIRLVFKNPDLKYGVNFGGNVPTGKDQYGKAKTAYANMSGEITQEKNS